jgi:hypothetical protein
MEGRNRLELLPKTSIFLRERGFSTRKTSAGEFSYVSACSKHSSEEYPSLLDKDQTMEFDLFEEDDKSNQFNHSKHYSLGVKILTFVMIKFD